MKKTTRKKLIAILATALLSLTVVGCASTTTPSSQDAQPAQTEAEKNNSNGSLGDYAVEIGDLVLTKTYDGKDAIIINMKYTNNSDEAMSYMSSLMAKAYQDGVELSTAIIMDDAYDAESQMKELKTGASIDVQVAYELSNTTSDVEFEVEEFLSFTDEKIEKTFIITQ